MSRRPLGASIPPAERLVVFEAWIRDVQAAVDELEDGIQGLDSGRDADGIAITPSAAWAQLHNAGRRLQELKERPFRAPRR